MKVDVVFCVDPEFQVNYAHKLVDSFREHNDSEDTRVVAMSPNIAFLNNEFSHVDHHYRPNPLPGIRTAHKLPFGEACRDDVDFGIFVDTSTRFHDDVREFCRWLDSGSKDAWTNPCHDTIAWKKPVERTFELLDMEEPEPTHKALYMDRPTYCRNARIEVTTRPQEFSRKWIQLCRLVRQELGFESYFIDQVGLSVMPFVSDFDFGVLEDKETVISTGPNLPDVPVTENTVIEVYD